MKHLWFAAFFLILLVACSDDPSTWEGVVEVDYRQDVIGRRIKRRFDLLRAGVRLREELAVARVARSAMGHTFIARRVAEEEPGVVALRPKRRGVPVSTKPRGIEKGSWGICEIEEGYWIVDVFSPMAIYLTSVVVPEEMPGRYILQHLGIARELSPTADRILMTAEGQVYWRDLLPVVIANKGYGHLFVAVERELKSEEVESDSLKVMGKRYQLEEFEDYTLVGQDRKNERCRHIFTLGGEYLMSIVQYDTLEFDARAALQLLGLAAVDSGDSGEE